MALQITSNTPILLDNGIAVSSLYGRVNPTLDLSGKIIFCQPLFFSSKQNFQDNKTPVEVNFNLNAFLDYDATTQGSNLLSLSNEWVKSQLESKGLSVTITDI